MDTENIIDVCSSEKAAVELIKIDSIKKVLFPSVNLSVVKLSDVYSNNNNFLFYEIQKYNEFNKKAILLNNVINACDHFRIWVAENNAGDRCLLMLIAGIFKNHKISVIYVGNKYDNNIIERIYNISDLDSDSLKGFINNETLLSKSETTVIQNKWKQLLNENSDIRIILNDEIISADSDYFDSDIITIIEKTYNTSFSHQLAELINRFPFLPESFLSNKLTELS